MSSVIVVGMFWFPLVIHLIILLPVRVTFRTFSDEPGDSFGFFDTVRFQKNISKG